MGYGVEVRSAAPAFYPERSDGPMDDAPRRPGEAEAEGLSARLLFVGPAAAVPDIEQVGGVRLVHRLSASSAAEHIRQMAAVDIVWVAAADMVESEIWTGLCAAVAERKSGLVCETSLAALDRVASIVPAAVNTEWLVDADTTERLVALVAARTAATRGRGLALHDISRSDAMERIDRLQDEVARISRMLGELAGQGGSVGLPVGFGPRPAAISACSGQVRAPVRDFAASPRSFMPDERVIERQQARQVRGLLRRRRMREQYFPADLFADPAWDMLLDLYAARLEHQPVSVSSLCIAAAVPATTALRWIKTMTDAGLFLREADPQDGRRIFLALADSAAEAMARYFEALEE
jgi:hypothetical protein